MEQMNIMFFVLSSLVIIIVPGPDILFVLSQGISLGKRAGISCALGLSTGVIVHTLIAAFGLAIIFQTSAIAFMLLQYCGVAYLLYLAYMAYTQRKNYINIDVDNNIISIKKLFVRGFLMNVLNPKVSLFFIAFLPQFIVTDSGNVTFQILVLGLIFLLLTALVFSLVGLFSAYSGHWIRNNPNYNKYIGLVIALLFFSLAIKLAFL